MNINGIMKATVPVVVGIFVAGLLMNALRDNDIVNQAISGYDA